LFYVGWASVGTLHIKALRGRERVFWIKERQRETERDRETQKDTERHRETERERESSSWQCSSKKEEEEEKEKKKIKKVRHWTVMVDAAKTQHACLRYDEGSTDHDHRP